MASYFVPPVFAAFLWWFSTGAVLLLVGMSGRFGWLRAVIAIGLVVGSLIGLAASADDVSASAAYVSFTCTILLWGAQEIAFLAGWLTGPRAEPCPANAKGARRLGFALRAILYHEVALLICGAAIVALTWGGSNPVAAWTFAALWTLRQSAKINLFLGVPVTNDQLMPIPVQFLKTYFARKSVSAFFPISVSLACAALVIMIQRIVEVAATPFEIVSLTLVSTLFALGVLEHWFMLLPMPAVTLWSWGMRPQSPPEEMKMDQSPDSADSPAVAVTPLTSPITAATKCRDSNARQRLEDKFRQRFLEQHPASGLATAVGLGADTAVTINGRTS
jgi:putative photosynthetic complex assembly protein 2